MSNDINYRGVNAGSFRVLAPYGIPHVLADLSSIAISEKMAAKFFESSDCIGKTLILKDGNKNEAFIISGVFKEPPTQSLMQFDFVIPFTRFLANNSWALETGATADETIQLSVFHPVLFTSQLCGW